MLNYYGLFLLLLQCFAIIEFSSSQYRRVESQEVGHPLHFHINLDDTFSRDYLESDLFSGECFCGQENRPRDFANKIVGGKVVGENQYPWHALVFGYNGKKSLKANYVFIS